MKSRTEIGQAVETLVIPLLKEKGYRIIERNWRIRRAEIDIIAWQDETLCFIEVRSKSSKTFGSPEESVSPTKAKRLHLAAAAYLTRWSHKAPYCRFDFVAVDLSKDRRRVLEVRIIKNILPF